MLVGALGFNGLLVGGVGDSRAPTQQLLLLDLGHSAARVGGVGSLFAYLNRHHLRTAMRKVLPDMACLDGFLQLQLSGLGQAQRLILLFFLGRGHHNPINLRLTSSSHGTWPSTDADAADRTGFGGQFRCARGGGVLKTLRPTSATSRSGAFRRRCLDEPFSRSRQCSSYPCHRSI